MLYKKFDVNGMKNFPTPSACLSFCLSGNARVSCARHPKSIVAFHAMIANQNILQQILRNKNFLRSLC